MTSLGRLRRLNSRIPKSDHTVVTAIDRHLGPGSLAEQWAGHGCDHVTDVLGLDFCLHEVASLVILSGHAAAMSVDCFRFSEFRNLVLKATLIMSRDR